MGAERSEASGAKHHHNTIVRERSERGVAKQHILLRKIACAEGATLFAALFKEPINKNNTFLEARNLFPKGFEVFWPHLFLKGAS